MFPLSEEKVEINYSSLDELSIVAEKIIHFAGDLTVWLFEGEMGAGKTTLIKSICSVLGVKDLVSSPTFSLVNEYHNSQRESLYHFDFYRIKNEIEASDIGVDEYFYSGDYCFVEWPSLIPNLIPEDFLTIQIEIISEKERKITLIKHEG